MVNRSYPGQWKDIAGCHVTGQSFVIWYRVSAIRGCILEFCIRFLVHQGKQAAQRRVGRCAAMPTVTGRGHSCPTPVCRPKCVAQRTEVQVKNLQSC